jgi:hypothetical protein
MIRALLTVLASPALIALPLLTTAQGSPEDKKDEEKGWVQIFNGKNLTGWTVFPRGTGQWRVEDGVLIGSGPASHLFTVRDNYKNFRYRVEAKINDHGNSGQYFRTQFGPGFPRGYEAQINSTHRDPIRTGSLYPSFNPSLSSAEKAKISVTDMLVPANEWFTQEVIADGNHIIIKVNGKTTVDFVDEKNTYPKGRFALQQHDPKTVVSFRKIEVMELPPTEK